MITKLVKAYVKNRLGKIQPIILAHMVTFRCNMRCHYCNYWRWKSYEMSVEEIDNMLKESSEIGMAVYTATGGEPLVRNDIGSILSLAKDYGFYTMLVTNGLALKGKKIEVDLIVISLDTLDRKKFYKITGVDALDRVIEAIRWASERYDVCINVVLHDENVDEIEELVRFADGCNVGITFEPVSVYFNGCPDIDRTKLRFAVQKLLELKKSYRCILNSKSYLKLVYSGERFDCLSHLLVRVNPDGDVIAPCYDVKYVKAGNIRHERLRDIVNSEKFKEGMEVARNCNRMCYLICYVEPSMIFSSFRWCFNFLAEYLTSRFR
jgi:MoaA/NifB/PqqE/SkfB family radical SAM enzyme